MYGEVHPQEVLLATCPSELVIVLQGIHVPDTKIDLVVSQMQFKEDELKIWPLGHERRVHVFVVSDQA